MDGRCLDEPGCALVRHLGEPRVDDVVEGLQLVRLERVDHDEAIVPLLAVDAQQKTAQSAGREVWVVVETDLTVSVP